LSNYFISIKFIFFQLFFFIAGIIVMNAGIILQKAEIILMGGVSAIKAMKQSSCEYTWT